MPDNNYLVKTTYYEVMFLAFQHLYITNLKAKNTNNWSYDL